MKTVFYIFSLTLILSCTSNNTKTDSNIDTKTSALGLDMSLIEPFLRSDFHDPNNPDLSFENVANFIVDLNNNNQLDTIQLFNIVGWDGDPGDFRQIVIKMDNGSTWMETNFSGWVKFNNNFTVHEHILSQNQINTDLILLTDFNGSKLLGLFGWVYASEPGILTFIEFSTNKPRIMINRQFDLKDLNPNKITVKDLENECEIGVNNNTIKKTCN